MNKYLIGALLVVILYFGLVAMIPSPMYTNEPHTSVVAPVPQDFLQNTHNGVSDQVTGIYSQALSLMVDQQIDNVGYVTSKEGYATQFYVAKQFGVIGILAHNNLSGSEFFNLDVGDTVSAVYGDGHYQTYRISNIEQYQALDPYSYNSDFIDLRNGDKLTAQELFMRVYSQANTLVLQTCIERNGEWSWGRLFVVANPL